MSSKSQGGAQSLLRWRWSTLSHFLGPCTLSLQPSLTPPPPQGSQDLSTPVSGRPGPHSSYRLLSLLLLKPLPLRLQLLVPLPPKVPGLQAKFTICLPSPCGILSPVPCSCLIGSVASSILLSITVPQEGRLGILTLYLTWLFNFVLPSGSQMN